MADTVCWFHAAETGARSKPQPMMRICNPSFVCQGIAERLSYAKQALTATRAPIASSSISPSVSMVVQIFPSAARA